MLVRRYGVRFDTRTTEEVEKTRSLDNRKPYRNEVQKEEARATAKKRKGTWFSTAPRSFHKPVDNRFMGVEG